MSSLEKGRNTPSETALTQQLALQILQHNVQCGDTTLGGVPHGGVSQIDDVAVLVGISSHHQLVFHDLLGQLCPVGADGGITIQNEDIVGCLLHNELKRCLVAMGGGSPIDAAKAMWVFYEHPETTFDDIKDPFTIPELRKKAAFIAIPSTSGTATEVTAFSVITDYETGIKYPLADYEITPDIAIVDPKLAETMPPTLTAHTGMDALTHAIEAYVAGLHSPFSDPLALQAIEMIFDNLKASYEGDMEARDNMHMAQCLAGMAFSNALLGIVHSLAHKTGAVFDTGHIPHGCANAIYLPYVIQYNAKVCEDRFAMIARKLGLPGVTDKALTLSLIEAVRKLRASLGIVSNLKDFGVKEDEFLEKKHMIAERAVGDACTGSNPRETSVEDMEKVLECIYYGKDVTF